ncbi:UNVERIFIED_CONTAM: hypothetical protein Sindi_1036500 [Sesamum indicum]
MRQQPEASEDGAQSLCVRQRDNEPLRDYLQRFNTAALEVPSASQEVKVSTFSQGLLNGDFFKSLGKNPISKFDVLLARVAKYINMEDTQTAKKKSRGEKRKEYKNAVLGEKCKEQEDDDLLHPNAF